MNNNRFLRLRELMREYRRARGMTQTEVAQSAKMPRLNYHRIEIGSRMPRRDELDRIAKAVGFDSKALLREAGYEAIIDE
jgi:transcriptional regulator with XRE-family HTH domain